MNIKTKIKTFFTKYPLTILGLMCFSTFKGISTLIVAVPSFLILITSLLVIPEDINTVLFAWLLTLIGIAIGVIYILITKWIWQGKEQGRLMLFYFTLFDLIFSMWNITKQLSIFITNLRNDIGYDYHNLITTAIPLVFSGFLVYILNKETTNRYFRFGIK